MNTESLLFERSGSQCELCAATSNLAVYEVPPDSQGGVDDSLLACETCREQLESPDKVDAHHWRCLNDSMWSQVPAGS